jgi:putative transcriptional regulator
MTKSVEQKQAIDSLMAHYSAGTLSAPVHALVAAHLELSSENRAFVRDMEIASSVCIDEIEPEPLRHSDAIISKIFDLEADRSADTQHEGTSGEMPQALLALCSTSIDDIPWRSRLPGFKEWDIPTNDGSHVSFMWIKAGHAMPTHTHEGIELTLVLKGAFKDEGGRYGAGDIAFADDDVDHKPVAEPGEDCICFVVTDAPLRLTGPIGRFFAPLLRR